MRQLKVMKFWSVVALIMGLAACTDSSGALSDHEQAIGAVTVSTDMATYTNQQSITTSWTNMPGNDHDWVAIVTAGSPANSGFIAWTYIHSQVNGSFTFNPIPDGNYEARMYQNDTYTVLATSNFTVGSGTGGTASVSTDKTSYLADQNVVLSWSGLPGNDHDWVAIVTAGSPANSGFVEWTYVHGQTSGSFSFNSPGGGNFEARAYSNDTYTILATSTFSVSGATVSTDKQIYQPGQDVVVSWSGMPGNVQDFAAVSTAGSPDNQYVTFSYINGQVSGSHPFSGLPSGNYEARMYLNNTNTVLARAPFTISGTMIMTDKTTYTTNDNITVSWSGLPGNQFDWVALVPAGSPPNSGFVAWTYVNGQTSGSFTFNPLPIGNYEARAYQNATYTMLASSNFAVAASNTCTSASTRPVFGSIASGDLTLDSTQADNTVALTVPLANTILFTSMSEREPSPKYGAVMCELHDVDMTTSTPAGITCSRNNPGTDTGAGTITIHWTAVTFTSGVTVQRGQVDTHGTNPATVSLTTVDPTQSFVILDGNYNDGSGWGNNEFVRAQLVDGSTLDIRTSTAGTNVEWQVVTMVGASVQRGTTSLASSDTSAAVAISNAPSGSMLLSSYTTDNATGIAAATMMLQPLLASPTSLTFTRDASGSTLDVSWEVVSLPFATTTGVANFAVNQTTQTAAVSNIAAASSVGLTSNMAILGQSSGSTSYAGSDLDLVGEGATTLVTGANTVTLTRASSQGTAEIPWTVIDFAHDCTGL